jgi:hypothetical protein
MGVEEDDDVPLATGAGMVKVLDSRKETVQILW